MAGTMAAWALAMKDPMILGEKPPRERRVLRFPAPTWKVEFNTGRMAVSVGAVETTVPEVSCGGSTEGLKNCWEVWYPAPRCLRVLLRRTMVSRVAGGKK